MNTMRTFRILGLIMLLLGGVAVSNETKAQPGFSVSFQTFYDDLAPYGRWVRNPQYGSVWIPDVPRGFQPYSTNGYWEVTEYGNTWVSDYDWGWAPFHYGRWSYDDYNGWFWVPDYEWGPAWVNWRTGGGYYGWAPLGPGVNINVSINIPSFWWVFVPQRYITSPRWHSYCPPPRRVTHVYNQTVIINNYYRSNNRTYVYGPRRDEIERVTRRSIPVRTIDASASGRGRVIVAESSRGNDRYRSRSYEYGSRNEPERRGGVIDAGGNRGGRDSYENNSRGDRGNTGRVESRDDRPGRSTYDARENGRISTERSERGNPNSGIGNRDERSDRGSYERRENPQPSRERNSEPTYRDENRNNRYESPRPSERSREQSNPGYGSERSSRPSRTEAPGQAPGRGSYEAPQRSGRQERSAEPRGNDRSERASQPNAGRSATERSSRSPR